MKLGMTPARLTPDERVPDALFARIRATVERVPASRLATQTRILLALAAAMMLVTAVVIVESQLVYHRYASGVTIAAASGPHLWLVLLALVVLTGGVTLIGLRRAPGGFGFAAAVLLAAGALVAPLYATLTLFDPVHANDAGPVVVAVSPWGLRCLLISATVGAGVLVSFAIALRRAVPSAIRLRGAVLGAAAGAWAGLTVFLFCPSSDLPHLLIGHVLPVAAFTLVGFIVLPRLIRP